MPRKIESDPGFITDQEYLDLADLIENPRARLALRLMFRAGLRVSEAITLQRRDIHLRAGLRPYLTVRAEAKGNKSRRERHVPLPRDLVDFLSDHLATIGHGAAEQRILPITRQTVGRKIREAGNKLGMEREKSHPHAARHGYGRECALRGIHQAQIQDWMGHSKITQTQIYIKMAGIGHENVDALVPPVKQSA